MKTKYGKVLIIGGLGFIGKNLFTYLKNKGLEVDIFSNRYITDDDSFKNSIKREQIIIGDICNQKNLVSIIGNYKYIFCFAGKSGATNSVNDPFSDINTNIIGHLNILEATRIKNPEAILIFPSSRLVYGKPSYLPVDENHPISPESIYAIHKYTIENYYLLYNKIYNLNIIIYRISNPYGPYQFAKHKFGILNYLIKKSLSEHQINIYGDGKQIRDFIFIDDLSELLFQSVMHYKTLLGKTYNIGYGEEISLLKAVYEIQKHIPELKINKIPWPLLEKKIETGNYYTDTNKINNAIGWKPKISLDKGIKRTIAYYRKYDL